MVAISDLRAADACNHLDFWSGSTATHLCSCRFGSTFRHCCWLSDIVNYSPAGQGYMPPSVKMVMHLRDRSKSS